MNFILKKMSLIALLTFACTSLVVAAAETEPKQEPGELFRELDELAKKLVAIDSFLKAPVKDLYNNNSNFEWDMELFKTTFRMAFLLENLVLAAQKRAIQYSNEIIKLVDTYGNFNNPSIDAAYRLALTHKAIETNKEYQEILMPWYQNVYEKIKAGVLKLTSRL